MSNTIPGFGACERWIGEDAPAVAVATYDLDSIEVLRGKAYRSVAYDNLSVWSKRVTAMCKRLIRFEGTQIAPSDAAAPEGAGGLLLNAMNVAPEVEDVVGADVEAAVPARSFRFPSGQRDVDRAGGVPHDVADQLAENDLGGVEIALRRRDGPQLGHEIAARIPGRTRVLGVERPADRARLHSRKPAPVICSRAARCRRRAPPPQSADR